MCHSVFQGKVGSYHRKVSDCPIAGRDSECCVWIWADTESAPAPVSVFPRPCYILRVTLSQFPNIRR